MPVSSLILKLVDLIDLKDYFSNGANNGTENIVEFIRVVEDLEEASIKEGKPTMLLSDFLNLIATLDENSNKTNDCLKLMSAHASKGLEFNNVFICGLEEGTFPSVFNNFTNASYEKFFEERRLFFVAVTRAKQRLFLSAAQRPGGRTEDDDWAPTSRFISEIESTITKI
jgi:DNA helicase-2/ATP-dependent DNA helicase PcrA